MVPTITPTSDQLHVLTAEQSTILMVDDHGVPTHVVMPMKEARRVLDDYVRRELSAAFEEAAREPLEPWDIEATIAEARRRHQ